MSTFKIKPIDVRSADHAKYADMMAKSMKDIPKRPKSAEQCPSTKMLFDLDPSIPFVIDKDWRPDPKLHDSIDWTVGPDPEQLKALVAQRAVDPREIVIAEDIRHKGRNSFGDAVSQGAKSLIKEKREIAISSFTCSPPADLNQENKSRIEALIGIESAPVIIEKPLPKETLMDKIRDFFGAKGRSYEDDHPGAMEAWTKLLGGKKK